MGALVTKGNFPLGINKVILILILILIRPHPPCLCPSVQMLQDCAKARREVELHWRASPCANIVRIIDVYENLYQGRKCLLIVMEW